MKKFSSLHYCRLDGKRFDFLKLVLAIFIVGIHTTPMDFFLQPILRVAVPIFFIMTSYFFFLNQSKLTYSEEKRFAMKRFVKRYLVLYAFWFVVLLPITIIVRRWNVDFGFDTMLGILKGFMFGSTFPASWFLMASLINVVFVWCVSKKISNFLLLILGVLFYIPCCLFSNYYNIIDNQFVTEIYLKYVWMFGEPYNSFPVALFFVVLGKIFAENSVFLSNGKISILLLLSFVSLYVEFFTIQHYHLLHCDDCYLSLIPLSIFLFMLIGQNHIKIDVPTKEIRKCSTIIYCCHLSIVYVVKKMLTIVDNSFVPKSLLLFIITLLVSLLICLILYNLTKKDCFRILKWAS